MACNDSNISTIVTAKGDITCKRGDTFQVAIKVTYDDDDSDVDLSVYDDILMEVKTEVDASVSILEFKLGVSLSVSGATITLAKTASDMEIEATTYVYDIQTWEAGVITTIGGGSFLVINDVTDTP